MMDVVIFLVVDVILWTTGSVILWILSLGRFKLIHANRRSWTYYLLSLVGFAFWLLILFLSIKIFGS